MDDIVLRSMTYGMMVWRRRWHMLIAAGVFCLVGWVAVLMLPDRYQASTRVYVDTDTLLSPLLKGMAVDVNLNRQVEVMQRTLLSRPNLESVLRMTDLDLASNTPKEKEDLMKMVESHTIVKADGPNLFTVSYVDGNRDLAKRIVQSLVTIFVESNLGASRKDMQQARKFIDDQIAQYERDLKLMEERMATFKRENAGLLPQSGNFAANLDQARARLVQTKGEMEDAITQRDALARELKTVPQYINVDAAPQLVLDRGALRPEQRLDQQITDAKEKLDGLRLRFTDQHPDVVDAQRSYDSLLEQKKTAKEQGTKGDAPTPSFGTQRVANPLFDQVRLKLVDAETALQTLQRRYAGQQAEVARLEELAKSAPEVEAKVIALDRDYQVIKKNYEELLGRRESAKLSQDMDIKADKVQFRMIDPPHVPLEPNFPNRPLLLSAVLLAGLAGGVMSAFLRARIADAFSTLQNLREMGSVVVLGGVSQVMTAVQRRRRTIEIAGFAGGVAALLIVYGGIMLALLTSLQDYFGPLRSLGGYVQRFSGPVLQLVDSLRAVI
ncbi:MAG TPA: XrtA system polysaccharide chain length determinant [Candidatus Cybelea sp.]|nr:XrtA system polysaccharide chain length determinant [Candidatus Cybelea sp.]